MLRLSPNDNQGIRYLLIDALLALGHDTDAEAILGRYEEDDSAHWAWSAALLAFRRTGSSAPANKALARAVEANRHVAAYLLGAKPLPPTLPEFIGEGDENGPSPMSIPPRAHGKRRRRQRVGWPAHRGSLSGSKTIPRTPIPRTNRISIASTRPFSSCCCLDCMTRAAPGRLSIGTRSTGCTPKVSSPTPRVARNRSSSPKQGSRRRGDRIACFSRGRGRNRDSTPRHRHRQASAKSAAFDGAPSARLAPGRNPQPVLSHLRIRALEQTPPGQARAAFGRQCAGPGAGQASLGARPSVFTRYSSQNFAQASSPWPLNFFWASAQPAWTFFSRAMRWSCQA